MSTVDQTITSNGIGMNMEISIFGVRIVPWITGASGIALAVPIHGRSAIERSSTASQECRWKYSRDPITLGDILGISSGGWSNCLIGGRGGKPRTGDITKFPGTSCSSKDFQANYSISFPNGIYAACSTTLYLWVLLLQKMQDLWRHSEINAQ